jgi:hypothetical protein
VERDHGKRLWRVSVVCVDKPGWGLHNIAASPSDLLERIVASVSRRHM